MKERPILFSGPMVRAILDGKKTVTRRVVLRRAGGKTFSYPGRTFLVKAFDRIRLLLGNDICTHEIAPYCRPGDRLWVRETFAKPFAGEGGYIFRADGPEYQRPGDHRYHGWGADGDWSPSIHMPRVACRLVLEVTDVRVERLQDITENDAKAEGVTINERLASKKINPKSRFQRTRHIKAFERLWDDLNVKRGYGWDQNPWVWVITFRPTTVDPNS